MPDLKLTPAALAALASGDLENALIAATPGGIEAQEAAGQRESVANETLPKRCQRKLLEEIGIVFGDDVDNLFIQVQLPAGWKKVPTSHSMWSKLVDDKGRERASIFYKAAFYDRDAFMNLKRRYSSRVQPVGGWGSSLDAKSDPRICVVMDCDEVIWQSEPLSPSEEVEWFRLDDHLSPLGKAWLEKHYPNWQDPLAYWD